jgi:hypothetical protein
MLQLVVGIGGFTIAAALLACLLRPRSVVSFLLATYLITWAEVVGICFALSAGRWLEQWTLTAASVVIAIATGGLWSAFGRPRPPLFAIATRAAREAVKDPLVAFPLAISAVALLYTLVVTLTTAANDGDPLVYEVTRAAFWRQEHGIGMLGASYEPRLDFSPPVAETGVLATLTLAGTDRFVGLPQWIAIPALALATYGVGRRIGLERRPALWGAALVPTLPVVITQSWSAFTDLVFASFFVSAVYFGIGALELELIPFALAVCLGVGSKFLGPLYVPLLATILAVAQPLRRWLQLAAAGVGGIAVAGTWYLRNQIEASDPAGNSGVGLQSHDIAAVVTTFQRLSLEIFDLSGASGRNVWLYSVAAVLLAAIALGSVLKGDRPPLGLLVAATVTAVAPLAVSLLAQGWAYIGIALGDALGRPDLVDQIRDWSAPTISDGAYSWFGPVGAVLVLGALPIAAVEVSRRRLARPAIVLAAAPLAALAVISLVIAYQRNEGRYLIAAVSLCSATWGGFALRHRWVGTAIVGIASVTVVLSMVNSLGKPSGISLVGENVGRSVWSMPRWMQQGILRSTPPERDEIMSIRFVEERVPDDAALGIAVTTNSFVAPYFGRKLRRTVTIIDEGDVVPPSVDWIVAAPGRVLAGCPAAWAREHRGRYGWTVWHRIGPDTCSSIDRLASG